MIQKATKDLARGNQNLSPYISGYINGMPGFVRQSVITTCQEYSSVGDDDS